MIELSNGIFDISQFSTISDLELETLISNPRFETVRLSRDSYSDNDQFDLYEETIDKLNTLFSKRKDVEFVFFISNEKILQQIPTIERVSLNCGGYYTSQAQFEEAIQHLSFLHKIVELRLPDVKKRINVAPLIEFSSAIESLGIRGNYKNVDQLIAACSRLNNLALASVKLPNLNCLEGKSLHSFSNFGPKIADYSYLGQIENLKEIRIVRDRKTTSLDFIANLKNLETIVINEMQKLEKCPQFLQNKNLKDFSVAYCNAILDNQDYITWLEQNYTDEI